MRSTNASAISKISKIYTHGIFGDIRDFFPSHPVET
jgi:hypothetical protein